MLGPNPVAGEGIDDKVLSPMDSVFEEELFNRLEMAEKAVISLYRDGKSSPWDLTEDGWSHATVSRISSYLIQHEASGLVQANVQCLYSFYSISLQRFYWTLRLAAVEASWSLFCGFSTPSPLSVIPRGTTLIYHSEFSCSVLLHENTQLLTIYTE
jgi:hypothetical protein